MKKNLLFSFLITLSPFFVLGQWAAESSAPDEYGYTWKTQAAPGGPSYQWVDITSTGTLVEGLTDDNIVGPFSLGFDFSYYWVDFNEIYIGSNGYVSFQNGNIASTTIGFPPTPFASNPNDVIAPFMCDLNPQGFNNTGKVYYLSDPSTNTFIVSYIDMPFWTNNVLQYIGSNSFQVILDGNTGNITFQYAKQEGLWSPSYDQSPNPMVVGIENTTGTIGMLVSNNIRPTANTAVTFFRPESTSFTVSDVSPVGLLNDASAGVFVPQGTGQFTNLSTTIGNVGNTDITTPTTVLAQINDTLGNLFYQESQTISSLAAGERKEVNFIAPFNPPIPGPYSFNVSTTNSADINANNDVQRSEIVAVAQTENKVLLDYSNGGRFADGLVSWSGGAGNSGAGVYFDVYGYPVLVSALEFLVLPNQDSVLREGFIVQVFQNIPGSPVPGQLVFEQELSLDDLIASQDPNTGWIRVDLGTSVVIPKDGFFVSWIQKDPNIFLLTDGLAPYSRRTYEILNNGWAQYRSSENTDFFIRAEVDVSFITTGLPKGIVSLNEFKVFPNPSQGQFEIQVNLDQAEDLGVKIFDLSGRKVFLEFPGKLSTYKRNIDLSNLAKGIYVVQIATAQGQVTKKITIQ